VSKRAIAPKSGFMGARVSSVSNGSKVEMSRWKGMDMDISDDQQDITPAVAVWLTPSSKAPRASVAPTYVIVFACRYPLWRGVSFARARSNVFSMSCVRVCARVVKHACIITRYKACFCVLTSVVCVVFNRSLP